MSAVTVKAVPNVQSTSINDDFVSQIGPIKCKDFVTGVETQVAGTAGGTVSCPNFGKGCPTDPVNTITSPPGFKAAKIRSGYWLNAVQFTYANGIESPLYGGSGGGERAPYSCPEGSLISGLLGNTLGATCDDSPSCNFLQSMILLCAVKPAARSG